ncbi:hypothetical protein [Aliamphritea spongicola]|uniref:hypothetical protein n=1 Tax=Aliamphritea spongicola TaxID=707589 RepID=UPI00196AB3D8|nr:hypothetical protein [Aliamphritea spongicola]MBN3564291.1 hypothetical protein [Aliamphritea spongicola]
MMEYLKKYGWIALTAVMADFVAFIYWQSYLSTGSIHDSKHNFTFTGEAAHSLLAIMTLFATVCTYYFIKSLILFHRNR